MICEIPYNIIYISIRLEFIQIQHYYHGWHFN